MNIEIRPAIMRFATLMELILQRNDHKGGWEDCKEEYLMQRLMEEYLELHEATVLGFDTLIPLEAADVANFAMMVADQYITDEMYASLLEEAKESQNVELENYNATT